MIKKIYDATEDNDSDVDSVVEECEAELARSQRQRQLASERLKDESERPSNRQQQQ